MGGTYHNCDRPGSGVDSVAVSYFETDPWALSPPVLEPAITQFDEPLLDAKDSAPAMVGSMWIAAPPDRASDK